MANPDGYDFTFQPDQRLWRKNLSDNDGDGQITNADGVDLNRNYADPLGLRQRGLLPRPSSAPTAARAPTPSPSPRRSRASLKRIRPSSS